MAPTGFMPYPSAGRRMSQQEMLLLAYLMQQEEARRAAAGAPKTGDLLGLAKDTGAVSAAKDFLGLGGGGAATTTATYGGLPASAPVASHMGGTMLASGEVVPMSMAPEAVTDITNFAGSATPYIGAAGTALGAYNAYKGIEGKNPMRAGLGGAGAALGLNAMGYALGPYGWAAMVAAPAVGALVNKMGDKDRWKTEQKRLAKLREQGINIPRMEADGLTGGRSKQQLIDAELAKQSRGEYSNVDFARTRDERFLKPDDIMGYATFAEKYGNDWFGKYNDQQRREIAQKALDSGAVREHHGTIDVDWGKVDGFQPSTTAPTQSTTAIPSQQGPARSSPLAQKNSDSAIPRGLGNFKPVADQDRGKYGIDPRDPNKYSVNEKGEVMGTLMGWGDGTRLDEKFKKKLSEGFGAPPPPAPKQIVDTEPNPNQNMWSNYRGGNRGNRIPRRA